MTPFRFAASSAALFTLAALTSAADPPVPPAHAANMTASQKLFTEKVRPYLVANCLDCHGGSKTKSGLTLATRDTLLKGGDRGAAVVPGKGKDSLLVKLVARQDEPHMPPKTPVPKEAVELLTKWVDLGAAYDQPLIAGATPAAKKPLTVTDKDRDYWAYRPLQKLAPPAVKNAAWARTPIDRFILAKLDAKDITPAADANKRTLLRRVTFDLTGLPPMPDELDAFLNDTSAHAYEKVVDRLLATPAFGERWARHWLDPARFAESHGFEHDYLRPFAYHYRDFVIKAFNSDMPYNQFVRWQVAGDELAPADPLALAATGFLGAGVFPTQITTSEAERVRYDAMDDMLSTTGHAMLGLTVGCARCHDHKYDPIPTRDYYRMLAAFTTTVRSEVEVDLGTPAEKAATAAFEAKLKPHADELKRYEEQDQLKRLAAWIDKLKEKDEKPAKLPDANATKAFQAVWDRKATVEKLPKPQRDALVKWFNPQDGEWTSRRAMVDALEKARPKNTKVKMQVSSEGVKPMRHHTSDGSIPDFYPQTFILNRGDVVQKDGPASPGFLQVLNRSEAGEGRWTATPPKGVGTSYRRTALANWLTDTDRGAGALAARVIVNRLWHHHFGRGIVSTVNDFGFQGDPPTHPELLEWLANDLVSHGWSLKRMHKLMVMSRTYQMRNAEFGMRNQSPNPPGAGALVGGLSFIPRSEFRNPHSVDADNRLWHHRPRRRLEAEAIRDSLLAVGGRLDRTMFGPGTLDEKMTRRSIYFTVKRSQLIPMLQVFDWPDTLTSASARSNTVVAPQALLFLNNPQVKACADGLAERLEPVAKKDVAEAVGLAYRYAFARPPSASEAEAGVAFVTARGWKEYALVLLSLNEFIFVD